MSGLNAGTYYLLTNSNILDDYLLNTSLLIDNISQIKKSRQLELQKNIEDKTEYLNVLKRALINKDTNPALIPQIHSSITKLEVELKSLNEQPVETNLEDIHETHNVFYANVYKPTISTGHLYSKTSNNIQPLLGSTCRFKIPVYGNFFTDMALYIQLSSFSATHATNKVKYCDFPGHKIIKEIRFISNDIVLDSYTSDDINMYYEFEINESKKDSWKRCVGQDTPKICYFTQDPLYQDIREEKAVYDGAQTFKHTQPVLKLYLPLQFWFCNPTHAMNNYYLSNGKTFIEVELATGNEITSIADYASDGGLYNYPTIESMSLFTNHIFVTPAIEQLLTTKSAMNMIRIHKNVKKIVNVPSDHILLNELKFAIERMYIAFKPNVNITGANFSQTWHKNCVLQFNTLAFPSVVLTGGVKTIGYTNSYYYSEEHPIDTLGLVSNSVNIYEKLSPLFYNAYLPHQHEMNKLKSPSIGSYMIPFNLQSDNNQHSGYLNFSSTRESYLEYTSSYISSSNPVILIISAKAINFLLTEESTSSIRFVT